MDVIWVDGSYDLQEVRFLPGEKSKKKSYYNRRKDEKKASQSDASTGDEKRRNKRLTPNGKGRFQFKKRGTKSGIETRHFGPLRKNGEREFLQEWGGGGGRGGANSAAHSKRKGVKKGGNLVIEPAGKMELSLSGNEVNLQAEGTTH